MNSVINVQTPPTLTLSLSYTHTHMKHTKICHQKWQRKFDIFWCAVMKSFVYVFFLTYILLNILIKIFKPFKIILKYIMRLFFHSIHGRRKFWRFVSKFTTFFLWEIIKIEVLSEWGYKFSELRLKFSQNKDRSSFRKKDRRSLRIKKIDFTE